MDNDASLFYGNTGFLHYVCMFYGLARTDILVWLFYAVTNTQLLLFIPGYTLLLWYRTTYTLIEEHSNESSQL